MASIVFWKKEKFLVKLKESGAVPIYKKDDKTDCSSYGFISYLLTTDNILSIIFLSRLTLHVEANASIRKHVF